MANFQSSVQFSFLVSFKANLNALRHNTGEILIVAMVARLTGKGNTGGNEKKEAKSKLLTRNPCHGNVLFASSTFL